MNASSNVMGGYAQRRADEALGYEAETDNITELENIGIDAITGSIFSGGGAKIGDKLFPIPNVREEIALLKFAHHRSTRAGLQAAAQRRAELRAVGNSIVGGVADEVPGELAKWLWQWSTSQSAKKEEKKPFARICYETGGCEVVQ